MKAALALGVVFDRPLYDDVRPLEQLLRIQLAEKPIEALIQRYLFRVRATRKHTTHRRYNWKRVAGALGSGEMDYLSLTPDPPRPRLPRPEWMLVDFSLIVECTPPELVEQVRNPRGVPEMSYPFRYETRMAFGSALLGDNAVVDRMLAELLERWVAPLDTRAGAVIAEASYDDAIGVAMCSGGMPGTPLDVRCRKLWVARYLWGPYARSPEWGTYLTRAHADAIGGIAAIRAAVEPYRILETGDLVFVQLTPYDLALEPVAEERRARLETLMKPILIEGRHVLRRAEQTVDRPPG